MKNNYDSIYKVPSPVGEGRGGVLHRADILRVAREAGFSTCGVAHVHTVPDEEMARYDAWIAKGCEGEMAYMRNHREIRRDPTLLLEGAKTIVSLAMGYTPRVEIRGFAHYAYGRDYHDIVRERAQAVAARLSDMYRVCVDTAPIMERYWAMQCGIGWIGRNHQLIVPHAGSEFFLAEILLTDEVDETDTPVKPRCGTCRRCIATCPTGALREDGLLDARRCNSYLTIEHRGKWAEHRPSHGCIYGCDECQRVCPWQRFAQPTTEQAFQPSEELLSMTDEDWRQLTVEQYRELFRGSAVKRTKYEGLMRNIVNSE